MAKDAEDAEADDFDALDDIETLPCNLAYVFVCILMPTLNGGLNGFLWPGYSLHFVDMDWPLVMAGAAVTSGFLLRAATQQMQLRAGYWLIVPLAAVHLIFAILGWIYTTSLWAVFAQIVVFLGIDPTCAIEGIAFDTFGASEVQARQASSTILSIFTIAVASSCTLGGVVYDLSGWAGVSAYHSICQGLQLLLICTQPAVHESFRQVFFASPDPKAAIPNPEEASGNTAEKAFDHVVPQVVPQVAPVESIQAAMNLPGAVESAEELEVQEVTARSGLQSQSESGRLEKHRSTNRSSSHSHRWTRGSAHSHGSRKRSAHRGGGRTTRTSGSSAVTAATRKSVQTKGTKHSTKTGRTVLTAFSRVTTLSQAGEDFSHHFLTRSVLLPEIVGATGQTAKARVEMIDEEESVTPDQPPSSQGGIPKDVRFPSALIVLCCLCNTCSYTIEFATFAVYFRQVHKWNEATLASVAQTAGDVVGAIMMQVLPVFFSSDYDPDELGCFWRCVHHLTAQPYNLTFILATWILFNLGMMSPSLPVAIAAQIFMGTTFVYSSKWSTDMNLFYSMGDSKVFMALQVYCRNGEALGGSMAGLLGTALFTVDPVAPFAFSTAFACAVFLAYTTGFCARLGFGDDIDTAEEKRSRRLGKKRVSSWATRTTRVSMEVDKVDKVDGDENDE